MKNKRNSQYVGISNLKVTCRNHLLLLSFSFQSDVLERSSNVNTNVCYRISRFVIGHAAASRT